MHVEKSMSFHLPDLISQVKVGSSCVVELAGIPPLVDRILRLVSAHVSAATGVPVRLEFTHDPVDRLDNPLRELASLSIRVGDPE